MSDSEQLRYESELKFWWRETKGNACEIKAVLERIEAKRGNRGADKLRDGLLKMWRENGNNR